VRLLIALALLAAAAAAAGWHWLGPLPVEAAHPQRGPAIEAVYGTGIVEPEVMVAISPKISGRLVELLADEGDSVERGALLARLEAEDLAATVAEWASRVRLGEAELRRVETLHRRKLAADADLDRARNELATAAAALRRAREQLAELSLRAPAAGRILRRDGEIGTLLRPGDNLFWFSCCGGLRISAEIDEEDIPRVRPGQQVLIGADAFPDQVFEGQVTEITPKGDPVARSFRVRIGLPEDTPLRTGMTADCNIVVERRADALLIPAGAAADGGLWLVRAGRLVRQAVTLGAGAGIDGGLVEVRAGLLPEDLVVTEPGPGLRAGRRVRLRGGPAP
jgi:RND family efflux transporter MFP subunit